MKKARLILAVTIALIIIPITSASCTVQPRDARVINVGFSSDLPSADASYLASQLSLDQSINLTKIPSSSVVTSNLAPLDVLVVAGANITPSQAIAIATWVSAGKAVFVISGPDSSGEKNLLLGLGTLVPGGTMTLVEGTPVVDVVNVSEAAVSGIEWSTAPEIKAYNKIGGFSATVVPLLLADGTSDVFMYRQRFGNGSIIGFTPIYTNDANSDFKLWSYTPYFLFRVVMYLAGETSVPSFASWQYSPVPNTGEQGVLILVLVGIVVCFFAILFIARRASRAPIHTSMQAPSPDIVASQPDKSRAPGSQETTRNPDDERKNKWDRIGSHRQISMYFMSMLTQYMIGLPFLFLNIAIYSVYIQPFPMISGITGWIGTVLGNALTILDMGFGAAVAKYFSEHRVHSPLKALRYAQVYTWWEFSTEVGQAVVVTVLATFYMPATYLGAISIYMLVASMTRLPGFYGVIGTVLNAMQRFDVNIKINAIVSSVVNQFLGWGIILLFRAIFKGMPRYGEAFGVGIGMYFSGVVNGAFNFIVWIFIYKKLGFSVGNLFRIDFTRNEFKDTFLFGFKLTIGNFWVSMNSIIAMFLVSVFVVNYNVELGNYGFTGYLTGLGGPIGTLTGAFLPAISEAADKKKLQEYYIMEILKWQYFFELFLVALYFAAGASFLFLAGAQWQGALKYVPLQIVFAALWPLAWWADTVFQGTGHTGLNTGVWFVEQGTRLVLLPFTLYWFGIFGLLYAYIPGITAKGIVSIIIVRKKICAFKPQWMHTLLASGISGIFIYAIIASIEVFVPQGDLLFGSVVFFGSFILGFILHGFLTGFLGGWDKNTIEEFSAGLAMMKWTDKIYAPLHKAIMLGYRLSPLKERFAVKIFPEAEAEARMLTAEKVAMTA
ncbi:MAG TPA: lipopolysaccharide biosynthesis protein [Candidatus Lokiarchaeia archaeon]|nr:lipopolysaccharide biosynthesis protein [Candidatus Lokiarchaeia archaeon]